MKWFKHDCDASNDSRILKLKSKFGMEGYGVFFNTLELISRKMEKDIDSFGYLPEEWDDEALEIEFGLSSDKVRTIFDYMCQIGLFEKKDGKIYNSKIKDRCDDYTARLLRLQQFSGTNSEHSTDSVRTKSDFVHPRIDKNRIDKNIISNNILIPTPKKYSSIEHLKEEDFQEIATNYKTEVSLVLFVWEKLKNYCESKGKRYKNYKSALRNWVLEDLRKASERRGGDPTKRAIDARGIK